MPIKFGQSFRKFLASALSLFLIFSGCASSNRGGSQADVNIGPSLEEEVSAGKKIHEEILASYYIYTKPDVVAYVHDVGNTLVGHADRKLPYQFTVLYNEKIYATSAPGGYIYITTGMMNYLQNEAELAAILAHEIGLLQYRDPSFSSLRKIVSGVSQTGAMVAPAFGQIGMLAVLGFALVNAAAKMGEKDPGGRILQADTLALDYLIQSGYDPQGLMDVLERFLDADEKVMPYFSDYYKARPISKERILNLEKEFSELNLEGKELLTRPQIYQDFTKPIREIYKH